MWRRKCERIGRVNYPPGNIQGDLVMRVSILSSGQLDYVRIVRSSGSSLLDNAALQTVRQAAPYQPFSVDMRKAYDRLEFTRTWQYSKFGTDIDR
jgi:protein TonB